MDLQSALWNTLTRRCGLVTTIDSMQDLRSCYRRIRVLGNPIVRPFVEKRRGSSRDVAGSPRQTRDGRLRWWQADLLE